MDIRPIDLPDLRSRLVAERDGIGPAALAEASNFSTADFAAVTGFKLTASEMAVRETSKLAAADLYHVTSEMSGLARVAAKTLPSFALEPEDIPSEVGMAFFAGGIGGPLNEATQERMNIHVMCWQALTHGVMIAFYADIQSLARWTDGPDAVWLEDLPVRHAPEKIFAAHAGTGWWRFGGEVDHLHVDPNSAFVVCGPTLRAAWLLMSQPVASVVDAQFDRATRRRMPKDQEPPRVRVITLRRPAGSGSGESDREYHHQWIVRGHWRQQWYPARQVHRPVWIAPHVKGPEGAPLLGGEKVYAWSR